MLSIVRKHAQSWLIKAALIMIVAVFILWGGYSIKENRASRLARVDDYYITTNEYNKTYNAMLENYRTRFGKSFSEELLKQLGLKEQALDSIINRYLIMRAAGKMGLSATSEDIRRMIIAYPVFLRDGKFDQGVYKSLLQQRRLTPQEFENDIAETLTIQNVQDFVKRRAAVTDRELQTYVEFNNSLVQVAYAEFDPKAYENRVSVDDNGVQAYYQAHQDKYREPEKRQFAMVVFSPESYVGEGAKISEEEITAYYDDHKKQFHREAEVRARHILFKVAEDAPENEAEEVRGRAEKVLKEAKKQGADFAALATKYSQDASGTSKGGDLGYFTHDKMVAPFANAAFSLKPGEISDLVRSRFGFHIIKVEDARPEKTVSLDDARVQIVKTIQLDNGRRIAYDKAKDFVDQAYADRDIVKTAQTLKLEVDGGDTWFAKSDAALPKVGRAPEALEELFALENKGISKLIETPQGYLVAQVMGIQPPQVPPFEQVKDRVVNDWKAGEAARMAKESAAEFLAAVREKKSLQGVAQEKKIQVKTSQWFSRQNPGAEFQSLGAEMEQLFGLGESAPFTEAPLVAGNKFLVCQFMGKKTPAAETLEKEMPSIRKQLLQEKQTEVWSAWMADLQSKARIEKFHAL